MPHVLIVDDDPSTREALAAIIGEDGLTTATAGDLREARIQLVRQTPDVVFTDLKLPDGSGVDLFEDLDPRSGVEVIVITGHATVESAVSALKMGATDYLVKPINMQRVKAILSRLPRPGDLKAEIGTLRGELRRMGRFGLMLGNSPAMQTVYDQIGRVAPTAASVLLIGESGTGKEVAAQTLHELSLRRKHAFIAVNCGAISPNLIESEMFGHERGSFTGADRQHKGYFERANGGTLFLDEITEMPIELQVKLLRVLETGMFMRVGTTKELETDVRLIAATNRDPEQAVLEGKLRLDLYHRLNVFPINLPPLRERGKDVELLGAGVPRRTQFALQHEEAVSVGGARNARVVSVAGQRARTEELCAARLHHVGRGFGQHGDRAAADLAVEAVGGNGGDDRIRHLARRSRSPAHSRDARAMRRREDARGRDPRHQPEDAV